MLISKQFNFHARLASNTILKITITNLKLIVSFCIIFNQAELKKNTLNNTCCLRLTNVPYGQFSSIRIHFMLLDLILESKCIHSSSQAFYRPLRPIAATTHCLRRSLFFAHSSAFLIFRSFKSSCNLSIHICLGGRPLDLLVHLVINPIILISILIHVLLRSQYRLSNYAFVSPSHNLHRYFSQVYLPYNLSFKHFYLLLV